MVEWDSKGRITLGLVEGCAGSHIAHQGADFAGLAAWEGKDGGEEGDGGDGELHFGGWGLAVFR
jgi:hypothetical protein